MRFPSPGPSFFIVALSILLEAVDGFRLGFANLRTALIRALSMLIRRRTSSML